MRLNRRTFIAATAAAGSTLAAPMVRAAGHGVPNVVVIGGGAGGATAARYIAQDGGDTVSVTLIEPTRSYYTCFFSNLYIGGFRELDSLAHGYGTLASEYGINVVHDWVTGIDRDAREVTTANGARLPYDRLIISPGIDFIEDSVPGWSLAAQNAMPHAYKAGSQTALLKAQVEAMPEGGTFAMVAPPNPYRCPPGPYERVSMVARLLSQTNPTAKILVADPKETFSKMALFQDGWAEYYGGMVERIGPDFGGGNVEVDPAAMTLSIDGSVETVDVCNVIPAQRAGNVLHDAALVDGDWAPVNAADLSSTMDENIHILGDSAAQGDMPKSGFSANSQAKVCANAVLGALTGSNVFPARFSNTCWSLIADEDAVKVGATYEATPEKIAKLTGFVSEVGETDELRATTAEEARGWYDAIVADMFGTV